MPTDDATRPPLDQDRLLAPDGWAVEVLPEAGSTNALAAERARAGAPEGTVVVTEHQTAGRGRLDRTWTTPPRAALTFSTVLRPATVPQAAWPWLPLLTGVAVVRGLAPAGVAAGLKWPNDVLVGDRKLAGLLVERVETPTGPAAVVGIGLNASTTADELPVATATSVALETGAAVDRTALLGSLLAALAGEYAAWRAAPGTDEPGGGSLRASYAAACTTVGRRVRVHLPGDQELVGEAVGVDASGRLEVAGPDGVVAVGAGDVVHVRPFA